MAVPALPALGMPCTFAWSAANFMPACCLSSHTQGLKLTDVINRSHENPKHLPGISLGSNTIADPDLESTVRCSATHVMSASLIDCTNAQGPLTLLHKPTHLSHPCPDVPACLPALSGVWCRHPHILRAAPGAGSIVSLVSHDSTL